MASISDVSNALVSLIAGICYPTGTSQPSIVGGPVKIYAGWPLPDALDADLPGGTSHVSVWALPGDKVTSTSMGDEGWEEQSNNGVSGVAIQEVRRQTRRFQISAWSNTPSLRDSLADVIDPQLTNVRRLTFPDGSQGLVAYVNSSQIDTFQKQGVYRRDLFYTVNYATTLIDTGYVSNTPNVDYTIQHTATNVTSMPAGTVTGSPISINT
jgi:hypothetical protein